MSARISLNVGREKSLLRKHPWIFSKAINKIKGKPMLGDTVDVFDSKGNWLAKGAYSQYFKRQDLIFLRVHIHLNLKLELESGALTSIKKSIGIFSLISYKRHKLDVTGLLPKVN